MVLPLIFAGILLLFFWVVMVKKCIMAICKVGGKTPKYLSHGAKLIASYILVFYFIYLSVTRRALDIFNCNPVSPPDGYTYTEFTSIDCEGGICRCDDPAELQTQLKPWAVLGLVVYSIGFPIFVVFLTWFYRVQMKLDQLLRAHGLGDTRDDAIDTVKFSPRTCSSRSKQTYDIRKKFHKLYYHFKPGKVYWMLVILLRKFLVVIISLLFRANVAFMLSCMLLVLFASYVLQVRNRPYMSTVECDAVRHAHRLKAQEAEDIRASNSLHDVPKDLQLHAAMAKAIKQLKINLERKRNRQTKKGIRSLQAAADRIQDMKDQKGPADYCGFCCYCCVFSCSR